MQSFQHSAFRLPFTQVKKKFVTWRYFSVAGEPHRRRLYPHHIPTTSLQKCLLAAQAGIGVLMNPERADLLAILGEVTGLCISFGIKKVI